MAQTDIRPWQAGFSRWSDVEFRSLLEKLPAAAYTCDAEGLITYFNQRAVELWGRSPKLNDPIDRFCGSFRLFSADGQPITHADCWMASALRENRGFNGEEILIERRDGSRLTVLAHANPIHDPAGEVIGAVNVLVDITERKHAENILRQADRSKSEFLAILAHELRNPLAPMGNALALMRLEPGDPARVDQARGTIERQLRHLTRVIDDLLDVSRITRDALELRRAPIDIATVVDQAIETCRPLIDAMGHDLAVSLPQSPIRLDADPVRLAQVIGNLLSNASKYTEPNGRIWLAVERRGSDAVITVRDTGIGIAPEALPSIFDMFTRVGQTSRSVPDGLGIGLTLARRIVELHGGSIYAASDGPGRGSEFTIHLPIVLDRADLLAATDPALVAPQAAGRLRILIVDDNRDAAESLSELLELTGNEIRTAHDGLDAVIQAASFRPDVVLLDIGLPRMSGYDVAREIRAQPWGADVELVALTGWGQADDRLKSEAAGFDSHLVKPVEYAVLEALLVETASRRERTS